MPLVSLCTLCAPSVFFYLKVGIIYTNNTFTFIKVQFNVPSNLVKNWAKIFVPIENIDNTVDTFVSTVGNYSKILIVLKYTERFINNIFADSEDPDYQLAGILARTLCRSSSPSTTCRLPESNRVAPGQNSIPHWLRIPFCSLQVELVKFLTGLSPVVIFSTLLRIRHIC